LHVQEKPTRGDPDATAQLERPPAETNMAPPPSRPAAMRRPVDRWSTVFTVFAAVALVALLLLAAAVISSQQMAAPGCAHADRSADGSDAGPDKDAAAHPGPNGCAVGARHAAADPDVASGGGSRSAD